MNVVARPVDFFDDETIEVGPTPVGLSPSVWDPPGDPLGPATYAFLTLETDNVRFRLTGKAPGPSSHLAQVGDSIELNGARNLRNFRAVRVTANANLRVSYGRPAVGR